MERLGLLWCALTLTLLGCAPRWMLRQTNEGTFEYFDCRREAHYGEAPKGVSTFETDGACRADERYRQSQAERTNLKRYVVAERTGTGTLRDRFVCGDAFAGSMNDGAYKVGSYGKPFKGIAFHEFFAAKDLGLCRAAVERHQREAVEHFIATNPEAAPFAESIRGRRLERGMPEPLVREVFGWPTRVENLDTADGRVTTWLYPDVKMVFRNRELADWVAPGR